MVADLNSLDDWGQTTGDDWGQTKSTPCLEGCFGLTLVYF
jgi:hypothetical protein